MFNSERVDLYSISVPFDHSYRIVEELGKLSALQFENVNKFRPFLQSPFIQLIRRCEAAQRIIK